MQPAADDAFDETSQDRDHEQDVTSPEDARDRGGLEPQDDAGIPRSNQDGTTDTEEPLTGNHAST